MNDSQVPIHLNPIRHVGYELSVSNSGEDLPDILPSYSVSRDALYFPACSYIAFAPSEQYIYGLS
ncbi:hypothetical protein BDN72DRAFT_835584 [Pluteus cervinus]|uniref:Uncharacterized protein n=1 Tax=Pluteus cervinus TaxID=181527 RepID=A0ACD3B4H1_9AGAR|nr:hypothetical protein BDN72DRAFT_835584 [Pluteus cervinus]